MVENEADLEAERALPYLEKALRFTELLTETLPLCGALISSTSIPVVQESLHYLTICKQVNHVPSDLDLKLRGSSFQ